MSSTLRAQVTVAIPYDATWRYDQTGAAAPADWPLPSFDDSSWLSGQAIFAVPAGEGLPAGQVRRTTLTLMQNPYYFRTHFNNTNDPLQVSLVFSNVLDDGAVFYLNGVEVQRVAIDAGPIDINTKANRANDISARGYDVFTIPGDNLVIGDNVLAVGLHQGGTSSSDAVFGLALNIIRAFGPNILTQPQSTNVVQGRSVTLAVSAEGFPVPTYQWFFDSGAGFVELTGAVNPTLTINDMAVTNAGNYFVRVAGNSGLVDSATAVVGYIPDQTGPTPLYAVWTNDTTILLVFDEVVVTGLADDPFNYEVNGMFSSVGSAAIVDGTNVLISPVNPHDPTSNYTLTILDAEDRFMNFMSPAPRTIPVRQALRLVDFSSVWRFDQSGTDLGTAWKEIGFNDSTWSIGPGLFGQETVGPAVPLIMTDLQSPSEGGPNTIYFRANFASPNPTGIVALEISYYVDDAVVVFINGQEAHRSTTPTLPPGQTFATQPDAAAGDAVLEGPFAIPLTNVFEGGNIIAVELHQGGTSSSDAVWGAQLNALVTTVPSGPPVFTTHPGDRTVNEGEMVTFTAIATGRFPITYQWRKNGENIEDATNPTLTLTNVTSANAGAYDVLATNPEGSVDSLDAQLRIISDVTAPAVISAIGGTNENEIIITFDENVDIGGAAFAIGLTGGGGDLTVVSAVVTNGSNVVLTTSSGRLAGQNYKATINGVRDTSFMQNTIAANTMVAVCATLEVIALNDLWRYDQRNVDLGSDWRAPAYDDSTWSQGAGVLGVEDAPAGYVISTPLLLTYTDGVTTNTAQTSTYYYRTVFSFGGDVATTSLRLRPIFDDGIIVYLNGSEVYRGSMPTGVVTHATLANGHEASVNESFVIGNTNLQAGNNVVAVEVHQTTLDSSDTVMGLVIDALVKNQAPSLNIQRLPNGDVQLTWSAGPEWNLVEATEVQGPYTAVAGDPGSGYTVTPSGTRFYQLRNP